MASSPPNPREGEELGATPESTEETGDQRAATAQKRFIAPPASQLPSRLQFVALGPPGPSGVKSTFRTVKVARRVPTLPRKPRAEATVAEPGASTSAAPPEPPRPTRRDQAKRHACTACNKRFTSPGKLSEHVLTHTGELPFPCDHCEKRFNSKFKLARHNLIHSEARDFACNICGRTFNRKDHLTNHVRVHNPVKKLYTCDKPDCRKSYTSLMSYRKHAALHSVEEGNLQCTICDKVFTNKQDIVFHLKIHTGSRTVKNETDKKFTCNHCERKFFTAKDVRRHLVVHTGRRDFLCPHCPQKFGRKDHLVRHVKNGHPDKSWRSAVVGTSSEPTPEASAFEETYTTEFPKESTEFDIWKSSSKESTSEAVRTRVPSTDIIVEIPELDVKIEPDLDVKTEREELEQPVGVECQFPLVYVVPPYSQATPSLPYMSTQEIPDTMEAHLHDPNVELFDPGEGPSGLSNQVLRSLLEEGERTYPSAEEPGASARVPQRLPAFTQAFQTAQSPKPPPPPPPPH